MPSRYETITVEAPLARFAAADSGAFKGYAAVFGTPNRVNEVIRRGAFRRSLEEFRARGTRPPMFWQHNPDDPIGTWSNIEEDERGLAVEGRLITTTTRGREAYELLKGEAVSGLSIGFRPRSSERGPNDTRVLTDVELVEISLVSLPASVEARVEEVRFDRLVRAARVASGEIARPTVSKFVEAARTASRVLE